MEHYGQLIRSIRKSKDKTIKELVEETGLSPQTITKIEQGNIHVGFAALLTYAKALNVEITVSAPIQTNQTWSQWTV